MLKINLLTKSEVIINICLIIIRFIDFGTPILKFSGCKNKIREHGTISERNQFSLRVKRIMSHRIDQI